MLCLTVEERESWAFVEFFFLAMIDFVSVSSGPNPSLWCHLRSWLRVENQLLTYPQYYFSGTNIFVCLVGLFTCAKKHLSLGMYLKDKRCGKPKLLQCQGTATWLFSVVLFSWCSCVYISVAALSLFLQICEKLASRLDFEWMDNMGYALKENQSTGTSWSEHRENVQAS